MRVTFHGAAGGVTGSRFLVDTGDARVLVDCGLFQGLKELRERNWQPLPFSPGDLDAVLLTHAHIDHSGFLPALVRDGFRGPILCTEGTRDLCEVLLPDSGRIQEEDARYAAKEGFSKHDPPLPLYTEQDARIALGSFETVRLGEEVRRKGWSARWSDAGHILGASSVLLEAGGVRTLFSGDLGRDDDVLMTAPAPPPAADHVVMESTYGDRLHPDLDVLDVLAEPLNRTIERGGVVLIPAFAVGRTQAMLALLHRLFAEGRVPRVPVHVDSPMAREVTALYQAHTDEHTLSLDACRDVCGLASYARSRSDSKALDAPGPSRIIVSASGMLTGGRVLHHLKVFASNEQNLILMPGFQAPGTRGAAVAAGAEEVRLHGTVLAIRAEVVQLSLLSAHADQDGLVGWLGRIPEPPRSVHLVHGEPAALEALRARVGSELGFEAHVAELGGTVDLSAAR
jgi:metallo-beta-lactamase family protein